MRPVIGITCTTIGSDDGSHGIGVTYISAVEHAGGIPILLPLVQDDSCVEDFLGLIDGLLLSGGVDVDPLFYGEESQINMGAINVDKDRVEMILASRALDMDMPILAICRGIQMLNVAAGGTLYQDISMISRTVLKHRQDAPRWYGTHTIHVQSGSHLMDIFGHPAIRVNTFHHQSVRDVAPGFVVSAVTSDGVIEGIESTRHTFVIGVQCHPEGMWQNNPAIANLFVTFTKTAEAYKQR